MLGLIPIAMHSTGAGYEPQGLIAIGIGIVVAFHGSAAQHRAEQQADRDRAYAQFPMVRSSPFDVRRPPDVVAPRARVRVPSIRIDLLEVNAAGLTAAESMAAGIRSQR